MRSLALLVSFAAATASALGCYGGEHHPDADADADSDGDADADADSDSDSDTPHTSSSLDLLFVVDNSGSMYEEQEALAQSIEALLRELLEPTRDETTGLVPPPVVDLHLGVVSTDMGTRGHTVMTCEDPLVGDDGVLQSRDHDILEGCEPVYGAADCDRDECPWLDHSPAFPDDGRDPQNDPIWEDFGCIETLGYLGCGFEQQLEASLVALTERSEPGEPNEGFLREGSIVAIVYVTDEDDCSSNDPDMFDPDLNDELGPLNVRCALRPERLYPIERYAEGLAGLRPGAPELVVVAAIAGVPIDGSWDPGDPLWELEALIEIDPEDPQRLVPTCATDMGFAYGPARLVDLVYRFGANGVLGTVCEPDYTATMVRIARAIQRHVAP